LAEVPLEPDKCGEVTACAELRGRLADGWEIADEEEVEKEVEKEVEEDGEEDRTEEEEEEEEEEDSKAGTKEDGTVRLEEVRCFTSPRWASISSSFSS
jgi:hypothetical protein